MNLFIIIPHNKQGHMIFKHAFSNSLIIHKEKAKEITTVTEVLETGS